MSLLTTLLTQTGGGYGEIDGYTGGQWTPSVYDDVTGGTSSSTDFTLQQGKGYALYSDRAGSIAFVGSTASAQSVTLSPGWNLVGFPDAAGNPQTAYSILSNVLSLSGGSYTEIDGYGSGQWNPNAYDEAGQEGGTSNFTVQKGQGYALYSDKSATLSL
jgi:hypothetical protein